jgi:hypothetical protein
MMPGFFSEKKKQQQTNKQSVGGLSFKTQS